jgi:hypothetical protein
MEEHTSVVPAGFVKDYTAEDVRSILIQALLVSEVTPASDEQQQEIEGR